MKRLLIKLSILPVLAMAVNLATPARSDAQTTCPSGTFKCTCNGIVSCQRTIQGCWDSC